MSQENVELARRVFAAVKDQDSARLIELTAPDVEWQSFFALGEEGGVYRGHAGIRRYVDDLSDAWELVEPDIQSGFGIGSIALVVGRVRYRGRGSGAESESEAGWVLKFKAGKVVLFRAFQEPERTLEAIGLP